MKKTLYWVDKTWYSSESNQIVGDMGFSFCDAGESLTDDVDGLEASVRGYADIEIHDAKVDDDEDYLAEGADFPIYTIYKGEFDNNVDDDYFSLSDLVGDREEVFTMAYCTSERGKKIVESGCKYFNIEYYAGDYYDEEIFEDECEA